MNVDDKQKRSLLLPAVILGVCLVGGGVWFWHGFLKDRLIPKRWAAVPGHQMYRSGQLSAALVKKTLARHGIKVIVCLTGDDPHDRNHQAEKKAATELGIELHHFPLDGYGTGDIHQYAGALVAILEAERQGKPVLIHCAAGVQRTGGAIAFYRLLFDKTPPAEVVRELRQHSWRPSQNPRLLPYLNENLGRLAALLHDQGLLREIPDPLPVLPTP